MPERVVTFRQRDLTRALRSARAAGFDISGFEIDPATGRIIVKIGAEPLAADEFEKWKAAHAD